MLQTLYPLNYLLNPSPLCKYSSQFRHDYHHYTDFGGKNQLSSLKASAVCATGLKLQSVQIFLQIWFHSEPKMCTDFPKLEQWAFLSSYKHLFHWNKCEPVLIGFQCSLEMWLSSKPANCGGGKEDPCHLDSKTKDGDALPMPMASHKFQRPLAKREIKKIYLSPLIAM